MAALTLAAVAIAQGQGPSKHSNGPSAGDYPALAQAIAANPGRMVYVPAGEYKIAAKISIRADNSGLFGPGRIIQTNPDAPIIEIERAANVQIRDVTLERPAGKMETRAEAISAIECRNAVFENVRVLENRTRSAAIALRNCRTSQIRNCLVQNYHRIDVDDRTDSPDWGYAFNCIIGTGIMVRHSQGTLIQGNRVIENRLLATPEVKREFALGKYVKKNPQKGSIANQKAWDQGYSDNWQQGSAILVTSPDSTDYTQIIGNYIENAGQGIDIHSDHVILAQNIVNDSCIGMKAMHGSRNVLIIGNQFSKSNLWSIGLMPGAASHAAVPAADGKKAVEANVDGGSIIANNIISDFGYGHSRWVWEEAGASCFPIRLDGGQKPDNPPLKDVVIQGNIVYDTGRDGVLVDGQPKIAPPRYKYAVFVAPGATSPRGIRFSGNILHPGTDGIANVPLAP